MVLERLSWRVTCLNLASFRLLAVARRGPCGPTRKLLDLAPHPVVGLVLKVGMRSFLMHLVIVATAKGGLQEEQKQGNKEKQE